MNQYNKNQRKDIPLSKKVIFSILTVLILLFIITIVAEILTRYFTNGKYAKPIILPPFDTAQRDNYLGWKMKPSYSFTGTVKDELGQDYPISIKFDKNGFKAFGDVHSKKAKVFF